MVPAPSSAGAGGGSDAQSSPRSKQTVFVQNEECSSSNCTSTSNSAAHEVGGEEGLHLVDTDAFLGHGVAFADGDRVVLEGVEVDGDAERGADLVLTAVAAADGARVV